jgi:serine/threonine protein kinase
MTAAQKTGTEARRRRRRSPSPSARESIESIEPKRCTIPAIERRPFCTHECLLGLISGHPPDQSCPNAPAHGQKHISKAVFLRKIRQQLAVDRGRNADCCTMCIHGARGALLKVCLSSRGYTMVAKGVVPDDRGCLTQELRIYSELRSLQGVNVPVCCGLVDLKLPFHYDGSELWHLLFLSWAGKSLLSVERDGVGAKSSEYFLQHATQTLRALHQQRVLHRDVFPRNLMHDEASGRLMIIDFERSEILKRSGIMERKVLGELSPNRKRTIGDNSGKGKKERFIEEMDTLVRNMSKVC